MDVDQPRIAVFAGPTATILNSAPLVTSNLARHRHGLPPLTDRRGRPLRYDVLRPQRLAKPVTVYVEQFSAHPLEREAEHLYGPADGYLDASGVFRRDRQSLDDVPVYEVELRPEDGLIPLPYMAIRQDGSAWDDDCSRPDGDPAECRQPFYPDASRMFEEIDRLGLGEMGVGNLLGSQAEFDFFRVLPSGGYPRPRPASHRADDVDEDLPAELIGESVFPYRPHHLHREPPLPLLADVTNVVQSTLSSGAYRGGIWLEGSPNVEETLYWLNLLTDTTAPLVGSASPDWSHGVLGASGDRNLVDAVRYLCSSIWRDDGGRDRVGATVIDAGRIFTSRDVRKVDARPGGFAASGGHGGIVGSVIEPGPPVLTALPVWRHTYSSEVRLTRLPDNVRGVHGSTSAPVAVNVQVKDDRGGLLREAVPHVSFFKHGRYAATTTAVSADSEVELLARMERNLARFPLAGFVVEGSTPYGSTGPAVDAALRRAAFCGMPVVRVSRDSGEGFVQRERITLGIAGANLTATKARLLLMACLLRFGSLPPARNPSDPTPSEIAASETALAAFQQVFDTH